MSKSNNKNNNNKNEDSVNTEFYKNGMNRLHNGNKIIVAEHISITENRVGYKSEKNMFRVVRCCDDTERPIKYYFNSPEEYEKASGNRVSNVVKKSWERSNRGNAH